MTIDKAALLPVLREFFPAMFWAYLALTLFALIGAPIMAITQHDASQLIGWVFVPCGLFGCLIEFAYSPGAKEAWDRR